MISAKLSQLVNSAQALRNLGDKPLRGKLAYKVGKVIQQVSNELNLYDKARHQLLEKYCIKDDNGQMIIDDNGGVQVPKENIPIYTEEANKLDNTEIELNATLLDLEDFENIEMTPKQMIDIEWLIKKEEETE